MTNHLRVILPAVFVVVGTGCSPGADDGSIASALSKGASIDGANIPAESDIVDSTGHVFSLNGSVLRENGRRLKEPADVSFVLFFNGVVYAESGSSWSSLDNGSWVSAKDPRSPSASGSAIPSAKALVDAKLDVWALSGGVVYENGAKAGYSANVTSLVYEGGVIYQENDADDWWSWNGTTWVASSAPTSGGGGSSPPPPTATAPTVTLKASATSVDSGGSATLTWSSTNATGCTSSGAWTGSRATSGSVSTGALTASSTFDLSCTGTGGSASASATVSVTSGGTTTPPPTGVSWVYYDGKYDWSGDWDSGATSNYDYKPSGFSCLTGADCMELTPTQEWGMWIPYPQTSNNPNDTLHTPGIGINIDGYNYLTVAIYPTQAGFTPTFMIDYSLPGQVDLGAGNCVIIAGGTGNGCVASASGPSPMVANQWNVYNIPISAFNIGSILSETNGWIYKFAMQEHGTNDDQTVYLDQVGFSATPVN